MEKINTEQIEKELAEQKETQKEQKRDKRLDNLIPISEMNKGKTREEVLANCRKGGINSGIAKRKKKTMQQMAQWLLEKNMSDDMIAETIGDIEILIDENGQIDRSGNAVLMARMMQEAMQGNTKAMELFRDTSGNKPTDKVQLETITDADRALMDKINKRLNISTDGEQN